MLKDRVCLVTGAARGIGCAVAEEFARNRAKVVLSDVLESELENSVGMLSETGAEVIGVVADVTDFEQVSRVVKRAADTFGRIDVLVNNAGITRDTLLVRMSESDWDTVLNVNLRGAFLMTQAVAKVMIKQRSGKIVCVSSVAGVMGNAGQVNYSASKAGLIGLTKSAARELAGRGICVNAVAPGFIDTEMTAKLPERTRSMLLDSIPLGKAGNPGDVAAAVLFLSSPASDYITGQVIGVNGGLYM